MRPLLIEVRDVRLDHPQQVTLAEHQQMIQTVVAYAFEEAFAHGIGIRGRNWRLEDLDASTCRNASKGPSIFAVVIPNEILWSLTERRSLTQLLSNPAIAGCVSDP